MLNADNSNRQGNNSLEVCSERLKQGLLLSVLVVRVYSEKFGCVCMGLKKE